MFSNFRLTYFDTKKQCTEIVSFLSRTRQIVVKYIFNYYFEHINYSFKLVYSFGATSTFPLSPLTQRCESARPISQNLM